MADSGHPAHPRHPELLLDEVCRRCVDELAMDHAAVAIYTGGGNWAPAHATGSLPRDLEQFAFTAGEGPCFDALREGGPILIPDLMITAGLGRWPAWTEVAAASGIRSVAAFPIQAGAITAGVLTGYTHRVEQLDRQRISIGLRLADLALLGLLDVTSGMQNDAVAVQSDQLDVASILRADVHQAAGMVMIQAGLPIEHALARLRARAYSSGRSLSEVAVDVLQRRLRFAPENGAHNDLDKL